jgi:hypothetical protein
LLQCEVTPDDNVDDSEVAASIAISSPGHKRKRVSLVMRCDSVKYLFFQEPLGQQNESVRLVIAKFASDKGLLSMLHNERVMRSNKNFGHVYTRPDEKGFYMDVKSPYEVNKCVIDRLNACSDLNQGKAFIELDENEVKNAFVLLDKFATEQILGTECLGRFKNKLQATDFCLGYIQFITIEPEQRLKSHADGNVYGDIVAVFCIQGISINTISDVTFELKQGQMYIFDSAQWHSVDCSMCKITRFAVTLRYYVNPEVLASL